MTNATLPTEDAEQATFVQRLQRGYSAHRDNNINPTKLKNIIERELRSVYEEDYIVERDGDLLELFSKATGEHLKTFDLNVSVSKVMTQWQETGNEDAELRYDGLKYITLNINEVRG